MGTSSLSSDIYTIFRSIQGQLEKIFEIDVNNKEYKEYKNDEKYEKLIAINTEADVKGAYKLDFLFTENKGKKTEIREEFIKKLYYFSEKFLTTQNRKLLILLDSIDQLDIQNNQLEWFFTILPKNVKIVYSVLKDYKNIFPAIKKVINSYENIYEIRPIKIEEAQKILNSYMKTFDRRLTESQQNLINKMIERLIDISPLQIKLISNITSKWKSSFEIPNEFLECKNLIDIIKYHLRTIEKNTFDNEILFKRCLFYFTLFEYRGISENELEDILSIDDEVLTSIFVHHHPPVRRFPMSLWYRIKYELKDFITNKVTDDVAVVAW